MIAYGAILGATLVGGLFETVLGFCLKPLRKFFPSVVTGTVVTAIGLSLILIHLVGIHYTGTSVNPARSFGPALFECGDALSQVWVFIVGPLVGGALAAGIWKAIEPCEK